MNSIRLASVAILFFVSRLSAQCSPGDIVDYWDFSFADDVGLADFWSVTDGGGCSDPCGGGDVEFVSHSTISDAIGNVYADGGLQGETVPLASPGSARSDATSLISSLPPDTPLTYSGIGYTYQCSCNQCAKLTTFSFNINIRITTSFYGPLRAASGGFCSYTDAACLPGTTPTCPAPHITLFSYPACKQYVRSSWLVVNGTCISPSVDFEAFGAGACN